MGYEHATLGPQFLRHSRGLQAIDPVEQRERFLGDGALFDRRHEETPCSVCFAALERRGPRVDELFSLSLPLGYRPACPLDVCPRSGMAPIDEQRAGPDVNGKLVLTGEVVVQAIQQEFLDTRFPIQLCFERGGERL
jgi:hypothetical protein